LHTFDGNDAIVLLVPEGWRRWVEDHDVALSRHLAVHGDGFTTVLRLHGSRQVLPQIVEQVGLADRALRSMMLRGSTRFKVNEHLPGGGVENVDEVHALAVGHAKSLTGCSLK
jgi:hypothetical protein